MNNRVEFERLGRVELTEEIAYEFELYWLKRPGVYQVAGDLGRRLREVRVRTAVRLEGDFRLIKSIDTEGRLRLRVSAGKNPCKINVHVFPALPPDSQDPVLAEVFGSTSVRDGIYREAAWMVEKRYSKLLTQAEGLTPLLDYSFAAGDAGLEAWLCAVEGNFTRATADAAEGRRDLLLDRPFGLKPRIHMPFLDRKETKNPAAALANAVVESRDEEITVLRPGDLPLEHHLTAASLLARRDPGKHPLTVWMGAPGAKSILYRPAYHAIAVAVQRALRHRLPRVWEQSSGRTFNPLESVSVAVYHGSQPWIGRTRTDFSYDCLCVDSMREFFKAARVSSSDESIDEVRKRPRFLNSILAAERQVIDCLINLGILCSEITSLHATDPAEAMRQISLFARPWVKNFQATLKGVLPGLDCSPLAEIILAEATHALAGTLMPNGQVPYQCGLGLVA